MPLTIAQLAPIQSENPYLYETLVQIVQEVNGIGTQTGSSNAPLPAPPNIASVTASGGNGDLTVLITDPAGQAQPNLGLHYFVQFDMNPAFPNPTQIDMSSSRGQPVRVGTGVTNVYVRVFSQFRNSARSPFVYFGTQQNPTAVNVSGATSPPPPGGSGGSGGGGGGFGGGGRGRGGNEN